MSIRRSPSQFNLSEFARLLCADSQQQTKIQDLNKEIKSLKEQLALKDVKLSMAEKEKQIAVATKELDMNKQLYDAIEKARKEGYDNAIKSLKEMKALASGL